ncbi:hypothetical protein SUT380_21060 (plasmid) [Streptococcus parasuis]|nr:hypothetical protein SUT380_21060 [Streptococcus parasuis]
MTNWQNNKIQSSRRSKKDNVDPIPFSIIEHIAVISTSGNGWQKELNLISWNDAEPKYDIRTWKDDHSMIGKGITLFEDEILGLGTVIKQLKIRKKEN